MARSSYPSSPSQVSSPARYDRPAPECRSIWEPVRYRYQASPWFRRRPERPRFFAKQVLSWFSSGRLDMKWITRERVKVDRVACPWLIKKFVDKDAEFVFVPGEKVMAEAKRLDAIPYDVKDVELGHHGTECSFEAIL